MEINVQNHLIFVTVLAIYKGSPLDHLRQIIYKSG